MARKLLMKLIVLESWTIIIRILKKWLSSYDETFKPFRAAVSRESLSDAFCLYSLSKAVAARDCSSGLSLSSLFRPLAICPMAEEHWITGVKSSSSQKLITVKQWQKREWTKMGNSWNWLDLKKIQQSTKKMLQIETTWQFSCVWMYVFREREGAHQADTKKCSGVFASSQIYGGCIVFFCILKIF